MTCNGQNGALQTRGTCWFYSIINGFLLSGDGKKILFQRLNELYDRFTPAEKAWFDDGINAPCPLGSVDRARAIFFWKFVDQFLCYKSGPRSMSVRSGRSPNLLRNMTFAGRHARRESGGNGAVAHEEIVNVLNHYGFRNKFAVVAPTRSIPLRDNHQFVIVKARETMDNMPWRQFGDLRYSLMCAGFTILSNTRRRAAHAITGFVCNGNGFLFDSNRRKVYKCRWWFKEKLMRVFQAKIAPHYSHYYSAEFKYAFVIYSRRDFVEGITPTCRLRSPRRPLFRVKSLTAPPLAPRTPNRSPNRVKTVNA